MEDVKSLLNTNYGFDLDSIKQLKSLKWEESEFENIKIYKGTFPKSRIFLEVEVRVHPNDIRDIAFSIRATPNDINSLIIMFDEINIIKSDIHLTDEEKENIKKGEFEKVWKTKDNSRSEIILKVEGNYFTLGC